jgi:hypothetical protein
MPGRAPRRDTAIRTRTGTRCPRSRCPATRCTSGLITAWAWAARDPDAWPQSWTSCRSSTLVPGRRAGGVWRKSAMTALGIGHDWPSRYHRGASSPATGGERSMAPATAATGDRASPGADRAHLRDSRRWYRYGRVRPACAGAWRHLDCLQGMAALSILPASLAASPTKRRITIKKIYLTACARAGQCL